MTKALLYDLGRSLSFGRLPLLAKVLWPMLLAASDDQGRGLAEADAIRWHVCPNVAELTPTIITAMLAEMVEQDMLCLYPDDRGRRVYQIIRWWDFQRLQWAKPSDYEAPAGWTDRIRLQRGTEQFLQGWDTPGGFLDGREGPTDSEPADATSKAAATEPGGGLSSEPPSSLPGQPKELNSIQTNSTQTKSSGANAPEPEKPAESPPKPSPRPRKPKTPVPAAVKAFREAAHRYPPKSWYGKIANAVGEKPEDLALFTEVVTTWVGLGWNPQNVVGMLEHYARRQLPTPTRSSKGSIDPLGDYHRLAKKEGWE